MENPPQISLTAKEIQIFDTLKTVLALNKKETTMRVAGGWVRDKLLGLESDDIDIALDDMMGQDFAKMISEYLYPGSGETKFGVIKNNSEQSKHLETAVMKIHDVFVDIVNLRAEEYAEDSSIPEIKMGTPQ